MAKPNSESVAPFLSYLQKRMDFIAQVATSPPSWCLVTDCDELINDFNGQYCLVNNIIRSHQGALGGPDFEPEMEKMYDSSKDSSDPPPALDIPHGEIGTQAFYTILENTIRNTAKYGDPDQLARIKSKSGDGKLRFTVSIRSKWGDRWNPWARDFCEVQIIDRLEIKKAQGSATESVESKLNRFLSESLTNPATGAVNPKNWGMKEIKICAAYLRMVKQHEIDTKFDEWNDGKHKSQPPIIKASLKPVRIDDDSVSNLVYTLYLLRPKQALVVRDDKVSNADDFRSAGIEFCSTEKFRQRTEQGATPRHSFLVIPKPKTKEEWDWLLQKLNFMPPRVLVVDAREEDIPGGRTQLSRSLAFINGPLPANPSVLLNELWTNWVQRWWGDFKIMVRSRLHAETIAEIGTLEDKDSTNWNQAQIAATAGYKLLVFDHHPAPEETKLHDLAAYHETISIGLPTATMLKKRGSLGKTMEPMISSMLESISRMRIKEAAALSVAVIDERVWLEKDGAASEISKYKVDNSRFAVWKKRRVYLQDTDAAFLNFDEFVSSLSMEPDGLFDFLIIHQGIIDNAREKTGDNFPAIWQKLEHKARWVVIDSGRGQPEQARAHNLRWVEYSNLAECLVQYAGNKLKLAELLWTLRASSKDGTFK